MNQFKGIRLLSFSVIALLAVVFTSACGSDGGGSKPKSKIATLKGLTLTNCGTASIAFNKDTLTYGPLSQGFGVASYKLAAVKGESHQIVKIAGEALLEKTGSLTVGSNIIEVEVTAQDGVTKKTYAVTIERANAGATPPTDSSDLTGIDFTDPVTGNPIVFDNPIDPDTHEYNGTVSNDVDHISLGGIVIPAGATTVVTVNGVEYTGDLNNIPLQEGDNVIVVTVIGDDGYEQTYVFNIRRKTTTVDLAGLSVTWTGVTENQITFNNATLSYDLTVSPVGYTTTNATIQISKTNDYQSVKINGEEGIEKIVPLAVGENTITVLVTSEEGSATRSFEVKIFRNGNNQPANIELLCSGVNHTFAAATTEYTYNVENAVDTCTVKVSKSDATQTVTINNVEILQTDVALAYGVNTITVKITATGVPSKTYTITINRADTSDSIDTSLGSLELSNIVLIPSFDKNRTGYVAEVGNAVTVTSVHPHAANVNASVKVKGANAADPVDVNLAVGVNDIDIVVTAQNPAYTKTYTVKVYRADGVKSNNSALFRIDVSPSEAEFATVFNPNILDYVTAVPNSISRVSISPQRAENSQSVTVNGIAIDYNTADVSVPVDLAVGINMVNVVVTAEDGVSTRTYTIEFRRAAEGISNDASLSALELLNPATGLMPAFYKNRLEYNAIVDTTTATIDVKPTVTDTANASVTVNLVSVASGASRTVTLGAAGTDTAIKISVTAEDGTTRTYTVVVNRASTEWSNNAKLSALSLSSGTLQPAFSATTLDYVANVASGVSSVTVNATQQLTGANAKITYNGNASNAVALKYGKNIIEVKSTAQDGRSTMSYSIQVYRREAGLNIYFKMPAAWKGYSNRSFVTFTVDSKTTMSVMTQLDAARDWWGYTIIDAASASGITFSNGSGATTIASPSTRSATGYYSFTTVWAWTDIQPGGFPTISVSASPRAQVSTYAIPFKATKEITLNAGGEDIEFCKYTIDGTDPKTSATANYFINNMKLILGQSAAVDTTITVKLYAKNTGGTEAASEHLYKKTGKEMTVFFKRPKTWSGTPVIHQWVGSAGVVEWTITGWKLAPEMTALSNSWYSYTIDGLESCGVLFMESNTVADDSAKITVDQTAALAMPYFILNGGTGSGGGHNNRATGVWYGTQTAADTASAAYPTLY